MSNSNPIFLNSQVCEILLENRERIKIKIGTYRELVFQEEDGKSSQEVYVAELADYSFYGNNVRTDKSICGSTRHIIALVFLPIKESQDSTTE